MYRSFLLSSPSSLLTYHFVLLVLPLFYYSFGSLSHHILFFLSLFSLVLHFVFLCPSVCCMYVPCMYCTVCLLSVFIFLFTCSCFRLCIEEEYTRMYGICTYNIQYTGTQLSPQHIGIFPSTAHFLFIIR